MDISKLTALRQIRIEKPCPADWDAMTGDDKTRFCETCSLHVNNLSEYSAEEADELARSSEHVCVRMIVNPSKGVLTRDGWIPRLLLAGTVAAAMAGCSEPDSERAIAGGMMPPVLSEATNVEGSQAVAQPVTENKTCGDLSHKVIEESSRKVEHPKK